MRYIILTALAALVIGIFGFNNQAEAGQKCASAACLAYLKGENRALRAEIESLRGHGERKMIKREQPAPRIRQVRTTQRVSVSGKSCAIMRQKSGYGPLVATRGSYREKDSADVLYVNDQPNWRAVGQGVYEATFCMPKGKLEGVRTFTICGSVGHYTFSGWEVTQFLKQSGRLSHNDIARMWQGG